MCQLRFTTHPITLGLSLSRKDQHGPWAWAYHLYSNQRHVRDNEPFIDKFLNATQNPVWLTEQNGVLREDDVALPPGSEERQDTKLRELLEVPVSRDRIKRFYLYHWRSGQYWDSAVVGWRAMGPVIGDCLRPAYFTYRARTNPSAVGQTMPSCPTDGT